MFKFGSYSRLKKESTEWVQTGDKEIHFDRFTKILRKEETPKIYINEVSKEYRRLIYIYISLLIVSRGRLIHLRFQVFMVFSRNCYLIEAL
jgi:hypothetical protein